AEGFEELDRLGWIRQAPDGERYQQLAAAYLAAVDEKKPGGEAVTAPGGSPTPPQAARNPGAHPPAPKAEGQLGDERTIDTWTPANLTTAQKADRTNYEPGDLIEFHQNAPGHKKGSRLVVTEGQQLPLAHADRFAVYRPSKLQLAVGDR